MTALEQTINDMITYHIGRNDDPQGLASELSIYIKHYGEDVDLLAREMAEDLAECIEMDGEEA